MISRPSCTAFAALLLVACEANYNPLPSAPLVEVDPFYPTTADDLVSTIAIPSEDADFDQITYRYQWYVNDNVRADLQGTWVSWVETTRGDTWKVSVVPWDGEGEGATYETAVTVVNAPPVAEVGISPAEPLVTDDLSPVPSVYDLDGDPVELSYSWALEGSDTTHDGELLPADMTSRGDRWVVTAIPNDGFDDGEPATASVDVANQAPVVSLVELGPDPATRHDTLSATVYASDNDDDELTLSYSWSVDDAVVQESEDATLASTLFSRGERVVVEVTANDGFVDSTPMASNQLTISNAAPTIKEASLDPSEIYEATTVSCVVTGWADADNDAEQHLYSWTVAGAVVAATGGSIDGGSFNRGEEIACTATPWDGYDQGEPVESGSAEVLNTAPEVTALVLSTTSPATDDTISLALGTNDDDGDAVTVSYAWYVEGSAVGADASLSGDSFSKGESIYVVVTPADDADTGASATSETATAVNTAPIISGVSLSPGDPLTDDVISVAVVSSDVDDDSVSYSYDWTVDGVLVSETGASLDGDSFFSKHESVAVTVTPNDGDDDGSAVLSSSLEVLNTTPEAPEVAISPADPAESDDLLCSVEIAAADTDLDSIDHSFDWTVDGAEFSSTTTTALSGDTVLADHTSSSEIWQCTVTPNDGEVDGPSHADSVTICPPGTERDCPADSCAAVIDVLPTAGDGLYWLDPEGGSPYQASCEMSTDGGGWTLVAVVSDDGQDSWTWYDRHYWDSDETSFGDVEELESDFKSPALHQVPCSDLLFLHEPSGDWAQYDGVGDGTEDLGSIVGWYGSSYCWAADSGFELTDGSIGAFHDLCETRLYFNAADHDGTTTCSCTDCNDHSHGPAWSTIGNSGCPFDDPASSGGMGPQATDDRVESDSVGFGEALQLNTGSAGSGENRMLVYAR